MVFHQALLDSCQISVKIARVHVNSKMKWTCEGGLKTCRSREAALKKQQRLPKRKLSLIMLLWLVVDPLARLTPTRCTRCSRPVRTARSCQRAKSSRSVADAKRYATAQLSVKRLIGKLSTSIIVLLPQSILHTSTLTDQWMISMDVQLSDTGVMQRLYRWLPEHRV